MSTLVDYIDHVFVQQFDFWIVLGFIAQAMFTGRFLVQWIASERARRSVVPFAFWGLSLAGGSLLLIYAIQRRDPVFILGQGTGLFIYARNIALILREKRSPSTAAPPLAVADGARTATDATQSR